MGKKKTRFVDPSSSQHFHLVHRSQRDLKQGDVDAPQYVLLPGKRGKAAAKASVGDQSTWTGEGESQDGKPQWRDHVNELGLPNDGYDYSRHLKRMGGGRFIAASGEMGGGAAYSLPEDPEEWGKGEEGASATKLIVDAITLSANCMDEDMEAALFGSDDENGEEFEELNDDFILEAGKEPEEDEEGEGREGAFDFEEHMARLIERSEKTMGWAPARGWEEGELEKLTVVGPRAEGSEYEYDDEDEEEEGSDEDEKRASKQARRRRASKVSGSNQEQREKVEAEFEDLLAEYSDEEIGELEDPAEEPATRGHVEMDGDDAFEQVLDDFLMKARLDNDDDDDDSGSSDEDVAEEKEEKQGTSGNSTEALLDLKKELGGLSKRRMDGQSAATAGDEQQQEGDEEEEEEVEKEPQEDFESYITKHEYLGDREETTQWDCETILSTCSNLDNHPAVIAEPSRSKRKSRSTVLQALPEDGSESAIIMIELSKKSGLPLGVLEDKSKASKATLEGNAGQRRDKDETSEEKAARKAAVKQARKEGRQRKKELSETFKIASKVSAIQSMNPETAVKRSVFQYS